MDIRLCLARLLFFATLFGLSVYAIAKPDRPTPKKEMPLVLPDLTGPSVWGFIEHDKSDKRKFVVTGNDRWDATGEIRKDGSILVMWRQLSDGKPAPGLYKLHGDGSITGMWGWGEGVTVDGKGVIHGLDSRDTLRAARKPDL